MKCTRLLGHKWSKWCKRLADPKKSEAGIWLSAILQVRRCKVCGYAEEIWQNSSHVWENDPNKEEVKDAAV